MNYRVIAAIMLSLWGLLGCTSSETSTDDKGLNSEKIITKFDPNLHEWPHLVSDLEPDPNLHFGRLKNGLRYIIVPEGEPDRGMSLRLQFSAGHLEDPEGKEGLAHLLEHMAFRGSKNVAPDDLIKQLEALGLSSGRDTNAYTFPDRTLYKFDFSARSAKNLNKGLFLFSEIAQNLTFDADLLNIEREVVLAEGGLRNVPTFRAGQDQLRFAFPQVKRWQTPIIGTDESLAAISAEDLRVFYKQYYKPGEALLVVTGLMPKEQTERLINQYFSSWAAQEAPTPTPQAMDLPFTEKGSIFQGNIGSEVSLVQNLDLVRDPHSSAMHQALLIENITLEMFMTRLKEKSEKTKAVSWMNAGVARGSYGSAASGTIGTGDYALGVKIWDQERRHILETGFTVAEIANAYISKRHRLEKVISGKFSEVLSANQIVWGYDNGLVPRSAEQSLARLNLTEKETSEADYQAAFERIFGAFQPRIRIVGKYVTDEKLEKVESALEASRNVSLTPRAAAERTEFKISNLGPVGKVVKKSSISGTPFNSLTYSNGVRLNYEATKDHPERIIVNVSLRPNFKDILPTLRRYEDMLRSVSQNDIKGYSKADMRMLFVGQDVSFFAEMREQNINFNIATSPKDLESALSVLTTFLQHPDLTSSEWKTKYKRSQRTSQTQMKSSPISYGISKLEYYLTGDTDIFLSVGPYLNDGEPRKLERLIERSAIEIGVAGDFDPVELSEIVSRTLGALPDRPLKFEPPLMIAKEAVMTSDFEIMETYPGSDGQMAMFYCWPLSGVQDFKTRQWERVAGEIFSNKLIGKLRSELGVTYGNNNYRRQGWQVPNFSYFCGAMQFEPDREKDVRMALKAVTQDMAKGQVSREEFNRAVQPLISQALKNEKSLRTRADQALFAPDYPRWVKDKRNIVKHYKSMWLGQLAPYSKSIFKEPPMRLIRIISRNGEVEGMIRSTEIKAEMGDVAAMLEMAKQYKQNGYTGKDASKVIHWYKKAASAGNIEASYQLGEIFARPGISQDWAKAGKYWNTASDAGHAKAKFPDLCIKSTNTIT